MDAGSIDDVLRFNRSFIRFNGLDGTVFYDDVRNLTVTDDFGTVDDGIFRKGQSQSKGPADAGPLDWLWPLRKMPSSTVPKSSVTVRLRTSS